MKIVVIGGTGLIGSKVVEKLKQKGHAAIAAAPSTGVNTITGEGLAEVLAGAQVVVDVANSPSFEDHAAIEFFQTAGRNLTAAEVAAGVRHHVALSVVGTERLQASGYFRAKLTQENHIKSSPIPYTLVRATQFFEFIRGIAQSATAGDTVRLSHSIPADGIQATQFFEFLRAIAQFSTDGNTVSCRPCCSSRWRQKMSRPRSRRWLSRNR